MVARLQYIMYVDVVFVISCLYSAVSLTLVREHRFIRIIIIIISIIISLSCSILPTNGQSFQSCACDDVLLPEPKISQGVSNSYRPLLQDSKANYHIVECVDQQITSKSA